MQKVKLVVAAPVALTLLCVMSNTNAFAQKGGPPPEDPGTGSSNSVVIADSYVSIGYPTFEDTASNWTCQRDVTSFDCTGTLPDGTIKVGKANSPQSPSVSFSGNVDIRVKNNSSSSANTLNITLGASGEEGGQNVAGTQAHCESTITVLGLTEPGSLTGVIPNKISPFPYNQHETASILFPVSSTTPTYVVDPDGSFHFSGTYNGKSSGPLGP